MALTEHENKKNYPISDEITNVVSMGGWNDLWRSWHKATGARINRLRENLWYQLAAVNSKADIITRYQGN